MKPTDYLLFSAILIGLIAAAGCTYARDEENVGNTTISAPIDYGHGVLYFPCYNAPFGNSLSAWLKVHPAHHVVAISGDGAAGHGADTGYWVYVEEKP